MKIIKDLIGFNSKIKYESSKHKKIIINTAKESVKESGNKILSWIS
jgi:adenylylsulfate kinase-like enzyme